MPCACVSVEPSRSDRVSCCDSAIRLRTSHSTAGEWAMRSRPITLQMRSSSRLYRSRARHAYQPSMASVVCHVGMWLRGHMYMHVCM